MGGQVLQLLKRSVKGVVPSGLMDRYYRWQFQRRLRQACQDLRDKNVQEVFTEIYRQQLWGTSQEGYFSGFGSNPEVAGVYVETVSSFLAEHDVKTVVDLGCGDFRVGSRLVRPGLSYHGIDIVPGLVERNQAQFGGPNVTFHCLDIIASPLPPAEVCLVRQVLQHLSNAQVLGALANCRQYKYLIVTEHYPSPRQSWVPNLDKPHGPDIRLDHQSAVDLSLPPFNRRISKVMCEVEVPEDGSVIRTLLIEQ